MDPVFIPIALICVAFCCEYIDSTLGMGYGTTLTPLLLLAGFEPLAVVPAILLSELLTGASAAFMHHQVGNVTFDFSNDPEHEMVKRLGKLGYMPKSDDSKIALVLAACSLLGAIVAVYIAVSLPKFYMKLFIGTLVLVMGIVILLKYRSSPKFSWAKVIGLGVIAAFNKGLSGGGYGPLVTSGQILSGVKSKSSIAITSFSESFTCLIAIISYLALGNHIDWSIAKFLIIGAMLSVPLSAYSVKRIPFEKFTIVVGIATVSLGTFTILKTIL